MGGCHTHAKRCARERRNAPSAVRCTNETPPPHHHHHHQSINAYLLYRAKGALHYIVSCFKNTNSSRSSKKCMVKKSCKRGTRARVSRENSFIHSLVSDLRTTAGCDVSLSFLRQGRRARRATQTHTMPSAQAAASGPRTAPQRTACPSPPSRTRGWSAS